MQTIDNFNESFGTEEACKRFIVAQRWPEGVACPRCQRTTGVYALKARPFNWARKNAERKD